MLQEWVKPWPLCTTSPTPLPAHAHLPDLDRNNPSKSRMAIVSSCLGPRPALWAMAQDEGPWGDTRHSREGTEDWFRRQDSGVGPSEKGCWNPC